MQNAPVLLTLIKLPFTIKVFVLTIFEWPLKVGFTVTSLRLQMSTHNICCYQELRIKCDVIH